MFLGFNPLSCSYSFFHTSVSNILIHIELSTLGVARPVTVASTKHLWLASCKKIKVPPNDH